MKFTIKTKIYFVVVALLIVLLTQGYSQYHHNNKILNQAIYLSETQRQITQHLHKVQVSVIQIQQWLNGISATRALDGLNDGLVEAAKSVDNFKEAIKTLQQLDTKSNYDYKALLPIMENYYNTGQKMAKAYIADGPSAGNKLMAEFDGAANAIYDKIETLAIQLQQIETEQLQLEIKATASLQLINFSFSAVLIILLIVSLYGVHRYILNPIHKIIVMAENLASGKGDLTQRIELLGNDELTHLSKAFNQFIEQTDILVSQVTKSVMRLVPMANELADTNTNIESAANQQRSRSQEVAESMGHTTCSVVEVNNRILQISNSVKESLEALEHGQQVALKTTEEMDHLTQEIASMSEAIEQLHNDSAQIETIIDVINSISEQTNLLALNAAIEAARAGDAGRGFAVVANEVRTLATRTKDSTVEVQKMIQSIQLGTQKASDTMNKGVHSTQVSVEQVNKSSQVLSGLAQVFTHIDQQTREINHETEHQSKLFKNVSSNITEMDLEFKKTLEHLNHSLVFGDDLHKLSSKVRKMIGMLKITDTNYSEAPRATKRAES